MPKPTSDCCATGCKRLWPKVRLGDVCEILDSLRKPITKKDRVSGEIPYYGATGIVDYVNGYLFDEELLLLGEDGAKWGAGDKSAFIIRGKAWVNNHAHVLRLSSDVDIHWLELYLTYADLTKYITGVTVPKLNQARMCDIELSLPPLAEQKKIVEKVEKALKRVDALKAQFERMEKSAADYFKAALAETFAAVKGEKVELRTIGDVCMCKRVLKEQTTSVGEIPFYKIGTFGKKANAFISRKLFDEFRAKYSYPEKGDVLLSAAGTIGRAVFFDGEPAYFQDSNIVWLRHDGKKVTNPYLYWCYQTSPWRITEGTTIHRLYNDDVLSAKIKLPSLEIQREVVKRLTKIKCTASRLEEAARRCIGICGKMRKAILAEAFQ